MALLKPDMMYHIIKYVGAHVNGNIISSSAIAFRLLFALKENIDDRQRQNLSSILDFIGYDHLISLNYSIVLKSKKNGSVHDHVLQHVQKDKEYSKLTPLHKEVIKLKNSIIFTRKRSLPSKLHIAMK